MVKTVLALLFLFIAVAARSAVRDPKLPFCNAQARTQLDRWDGARAWRAAAADPGTALYLSPTARLGQWLELSVMPGRVELRRVSVEKRESVSYLDARCQAHLSVVHPKYSAARMKDAFTDDQLRAILRHHQAGIIYAWSPHMPLSVERVEAIRGAGKSLGLPVFYVLDPHADRALASETAKQHGLDIAALRPMESLELFNRGMLQHFPSVLVFAGGKMRGSLIPGWKHEETYVSWVQERLTQN